MLSRDMLQFTVDPNYSGKNLPGWFLMNTYLQRHLGEIMHFQPCEGFDSCRQAVLSGAFDLVYANPFDWVQYVQKLGFQPVAKPRDHFDEVYLCTLAGGPIHGYADLPPRIRIASAHEGTLIHMIGLFLMDKAEIDRARLDFVYTGSYQGVLKALLQGNADVGFLFDEVYTGASGLIRGRLRILDQSDDAFAFHAFCIGPRLAPKMEPLQDVLLGMNDEPRGQVLLQDLGFPGFASVTPEEVECLTTLAEEYISGHEAIDLRSTSSLSIDDSAFVVAREDPTATS
ncbi:phosphate/phosphite/phosphonate ABC transporter substrate-binding protein [Acidithiobacillus sulfuriphilus]|uniref:Phosphate/phosphite/phosphonate ABC transporter substrate-binding protein n=2 Tax=Acidithiobacillus sulfuriphilus TaxID=1867749 RepID=A0A3M8RJA3_9PROT|nr:phosphate/phosphite/phosphonate ABC transporter substrate-binding protein [Acidithiobacillus sulfuriphilus]RNF68405.1 phosphate/phosphite/phosphonate ABC transporter substrate-binding protein [Acidithiobacillus sulfuriphilus]